MEEKKPAAKVEAPKVVIKKPVDSEMEKISTYNGDATEKYNWSQTVQEVQVQVPLPEGTKANQLDIKINTKSVSIAFKGKEPFIKGELCEKVKVEDSMWSIEDRKYLILNF